MSCKDYFHPLHKLVTVVNSSLNPEEVLTRIAEGTSETMECKACTIRLLDPTGTMLMASASHGLSPSYMRKGPVKIEQSGMDNEVLSGKIIHLRDATSDGRFQYPAAAKSEGLLSVLSAPLKVDGQVIGLMRVYSATERDFSKEEYDFLSAVADVSAIAIKNARLHDQLRANYALHTEYTYQIFDE